MKEKTIRTVRISITLIAIVICFGFNSSVLDEDAHQSLKSMALYLHTYSDYSIRLNGHTDRTGSVEYNAKLSKQRADAVRDYLVSLNIDSTKITVDYSGKSEPVFTTDSEENRAIDRRVEITIIGERAVSEPVALPDRIKSDSVSIQKNKSETGTLVKAEVKKKKVHRRLVWTGWRTGFHWSTSGR